MQNGSSGWWYFKQDPQGQKARTLPGQHTNVNQRRSHQMVGGAGGAGEQKLGKKGQVGKRERLCHEVRKGSDEAPPKIL